MNKQTNPLIQFIPIIQFFFCLSLYYNINRESVAFLNRALNTHIILCCMMIINQKNFFKKNRY